MFVHDGELYTVNKFGAIVTNLMIFSCQYLCVFTCVFSIPQYVYPSAYMAAAAATPGVGLSVSPQSPLSPTTASQFFDYQAGFPAAAAAAQYAASGFEAAYPYTTNASFMAAPAAYSYAVPQPVGHFAHFQPQQIQERMQ